MAKISPVSIKYMIYAEFRAEGPLEKPDVIGALFGQTEGLLGDELELRELQKEGKIGRIEVELEVVDGKSIGEIQLPSALDKSETTLVGAAIETIDRIGPTEAEIKVKKIEDLRASKRDFIIERAKALMGKMDDQKMSSMNKALKEESRISKIQEYGVERLPAGDLSGDEVIVVEGRADVVNLLKNRVNNVIGMNGTKLPKEIARLGEDKEITLFIDGDRGGKLIANNVIENAKVAYVATAPDGKEVEELEGKEILVALRKKVSVKEFLSRNGTSFSNGKRDSSHEVVEDEPEFKGDVKAALREKYESIKGAKCALLINSQMEVMRKVSPRELGRAIGGSKRRVFAVIIDGSATATVTKICDENNVKNLAATNFARVSNVKVNLVSL